MGDALLTIRTQVMKSGMFIGWLRCRITQAALRNIMKSNLVSMEAARTDKDVKPCKDLSVQDNVSASTWAWLYQEQSPVPVWKESISSENTEQMIFPIFAGNCSSEVTNTFTLRIHSLCLSLWETATGPLKKFQPNDQATSLISKFCWKYLLRDHTVYIKPDVVSACRVSKHIRIWLFACTTTCTFIV